MKSNAIVSQRPIEDTAPSVDGFPVVNHYLRKAEITRSLVTGEPTTALCGEQWVLTGEEEAFTGRTVECPLCADVYSELLIGAGRK
ncbi:hypothetical protein IWX75_002917 [Arthrobacter sp. CAN_A6]|uniref:DUF3039 domain-containing protein n=1 Tax=Arthrobacter sp. CAN_A6 TaxID=2787721 RepID=UPI0018CA2991